MFSVCFFVWTFRGAKTARFAWGVNDTCPFCLATCLVYSPHSRCQWTGRQTQLKLFMIFPFFLAPTVLDSFHWRPSCQMEPVVSAPPSGSFSPFEWEQDLLTLLQPAHKRAQGCFTSLLLFITFTHSPAHTVNYCNCPKIIGAIPAGFHNSHVSILNNCICAFSS